MLKLDELADLSLWIEKFQVKKDSWNTLSEKINELTQTNLSISNLMSDIWSDHAVFLEERLHQLQFMDSDEKYKALILHNPEILQRVSLTEIASFLGVSRETLSRIRAKK